MEVEAAKRYLRQLSDAELDKEIVRLGKHKNKPDTYEHDLYRLAKQEYERRTETNRKIDNQIETIRLTIQYLSNQKQLPTDQFIKAQGIDHLGLTSVEGAKKKRLKEKGISIEIEKNRTILVTEQKRLLKHRAKLNELNKNDGTPQDEPVNDNEDTRKAVSWCVRKYKSLTKTGRQFSQRGIARESVQKFFPELSGVKRKKKIDAIRNSFLKKIRGRK